MSLSHKILIATTFGDNKLELWLVEDYNTRHYRGPLFQLGYYEYMGTENGKNCYSVMCTEYFPIEKEQLARQAFDIRAKSSKPFLATDLGEDPSTFASPVTT